MHHDPVISFCPHRGLRYLLYLAVGKVEQGSPTGSLLRGCSEGVAPWLKNTLRHSCNNRVAFRCLVIDYAVCIHLRGTLGLQEARAVDAVTADESVE